MICKSVWIISNLHHVNNYTFCTYWEFFFHANHMSKQDIVSDTGKWAHYDKISKFI